MRAMLPATLPSSTGHRPATPIHGRPVSTTTRAAPVRPTAWLPTITAHRVARRVVKPPEKSPDPQQSDAPSASATASMSKGYQRAPAAAPSCNGAGVSVRNVRQQTLEVAGGRWGPTASSHASDREGGRMAATIDEIAPDVFRISTYVAAADLGFAQFLVRDEGPLLYHTGMRRLFAEVHGAVARLIDPATLHWIGFSHFEATSAAPSTSGSRPHRPPSRSAARPAGESTWQTTRPVRPAGWPTTRRSRPGAIGCAFTRRPICPTAGGRATCSTKRPGPCSAPTSFIRAATGRP